MGLTPPSSYVVDCLPCFEHLVFRKCEKDVQTDNSAGDFALLTNFLRQTPMIMDCEHFGSSGA
jgi:hypothetical protein